MKIDKNDIYEMLALVLQCDMGSVEQIGEDAEFANLGMTSVTAIQLVVMLEEKYQFEFRDDDLLPEKFNTVKKLCDLLETYGGADHGT